MKNNSAVFFLAFSLIVITACLGSPTQTPAPVPEVTQTAVTEAAPVPTSLTVCLAQEPDSLYPFGRLNESAETILSALYDGPVDIVGFDYQPVILTKLPSLENGDAQIVPVTVQDGDPVVDASGNRIELKAGMLVRPAGCRSDTCAVTYNGTALEMDQMIVTFRLRPDVTWSDGTPLTADDSVYSFELQREAKLDPYLTDRTQTYEAADPQTLQWFGIPGFIDPTYFLNIWHPAPQHAWSEFPASQLPDVDISSRTPLGWGPFRLTEWIPGESITLEKNPHYYRLRDGYPKTDRIQIRFTPDPELALSEFIAGRCDLIDPTINLEEYVGVLQQMQTAGQANLYATTGMIMEWLGLGIRPASYDNGYDITKDRQNYFADTYTRQAIAYCLDRQTIAENIFYGLVGVPSSYLPANHPTFDSNITAIPYDPQIGISLLEQAGWLDTDEDPSTPRRAINVQDVAYNTPLQLNYQTTPTTQRRQVAAILEQSLAECGIGLTVEFLVPSELYAPGPDGSIFGRRFDLAQYALGVNGIEPPCHWFSAEAIPAESNLWAGANVTGYSNAEYDAACGTARVSLREDASYLPSYRRTQIIFAEELPAIPLYSHLRIAVARPDLCGFDLDPAAPSLWNIESFAIGATCQN